MKTLPYKKAAGDYWALVKIDGRWYFSDNSPRALQRLVDWARLNGYELMHHHGPRKIPPTIAGKREYFPSVRKKLGPSSRLATNFRLRCRSLCTGVITDAEDGWVVVVRKDDAALVAFNDLSNRLVKCPISDGSVTALVRGTHEYWVEEI